LVYYLIQAIHPYADGNGRTGRLLYEIINNDELDKDKLSKLLNHENKDIDSRGEGRDIIYKKLLPPDRAYYIVNREVTKEFFEEEFFKENGSIYFSAPLGSGRLPKATKEKLSKEEATLVEKILGEGNVYTLPFRGIALAKLIKEDPSLEEYVNKDGRKMKKENSLAFSEDFGKGIFSIDEEIMDALDEKQAHRLIEIHKELKEKFIKTMIDIFKNPEKHKVKSPGGEEYLIKNYFQIPDNIT